MSVGLDILEMVAKLGIEVDQKKWNLGQAVIDRLTGQLKAMAVNAALATTDVNKAMAAISLPVVTKATRDWSGFAEAAKEVHGHVMRVGAALAKAAVVGFGAAVYGAERLIASTVEAGSHINDLAQSAGVPAEALQTLGYAAVQNSASMDDMATGLRFLSRNMYEAANGGKAQAEAFRKMGIPIKDARGQLRPTEDVLADVADHFASMPDGAKKTAQAIAILGRSGAALIPTLNVGSKGLAAYADEAKALGGVMDNDTVAAMDNLGDTTDKLKFALTGIKNQAVATLVPVLMEAATAMLAWIKENRELIKSGLKSAIEAIVAVARVFVAVIGAGIKVVQFIAGHSRILHAVLGTLAVVFGYVAIAAAAAWIAGAAPIIGIMAAIAAVILIVEDLYQWFEGGDSYIRDLYEAVKTWIGDQLTSVWDSTFGYLRDEFEAFVDWVLGKLEWIWDKMQSIGHAVSHPWETAKSIAGSIVGGGGSEAIASVPPAFAPSSSGSGSGGAPSVVVQPSSLTLTVTAPVGGDVHDFLRVIAPAIDEHWDARMREFAAATGGKGQGR